MDDAVYRSHDEVREQGRKAALAGREIWCNPHLGGEAALWFAGWREVPEAERGSRPDLKPKASAVRRKPGRGRAIGTSSGAGIRALGDRCLPGSTPFSAAIQAEVAEAEARTPKPWAIDGVGL